MSSSLLLLLLLLVCSAQASHFYGTVMTYYPKNTSADGSLRVVLRYKLSFRSCTDMDIWDCISGNGNGCGTQTSLVLNVVDTESSGEWCQREGIMTRQVSTDAPFQLRLDGGNWISTRNSISRWRAVTLVELRNRTDTGRANRSPQTTILPAVRVPSNCQRVFNLLAFDPDGDEVKCRNGISTSECNPCTPPPVLTLTSTCSLSFSPTSSSNEGAYAVQLVMEDFPRQNISLVGTSSPQIRTTNDAISKIPVQFGLRVDAAVPSCTEGLYLPKFLPPTPDDGARLFTSVNQSVEIRISAEANISTISELLFSGPHNTSQTTSGAGQFILRWTPSADEDGESHPMCYVVQATASSAKYHSELRCLIVTVGDNPTVTTTVPATTTLPTTTPSMTTSTVPTTLPTTTTTPSTTSTSTVPTTLPTTTTTPSTTSTSMATTTLPTTTTTPSTTSTSTVPTTLPTTTTTPSTTSTSTVPTTLPTTTTTPSTTSTSTVPTTLPTTTTTPSTTTTVPTTRSTTTTQPPTPTTTTTPSTPSTTTVISTTTPEATTNITTPVTTPDGTTPSPTPEPNQVVIGLRARISSLSPLSEDVIRNVVIQQLRDELVRQGLPADATLRLVSSMQLESTTTATPAVTT